MGNNQAYSVSFLFVGPLYEGEGFPTRPGKVKISILVEEVPNEHVAVQYATEFMNDNIPLMEDYQAFKLLGVDYKDWGDEV